jgi:hypothetical protein
MPSTASTIDPPRKSVTTWKTSSASRKRSSRPVVAQCKASGGTYYHIRGTEAHVGQSGEYEERLARTLGAKPNAEGQYARFDLWKRVGEALVHLLHHIGTTSSAAHESSAVNAELTAEYVEAARWNREPPDYIVRSHRHRSIAVDLNSAKGYAAGVVTPAWQLKTPYVWKIPGARISEPQLGGIVIRQGDEEHFLSTQSLEHGPEPRRMITRDEWLKALADVGLTDEHDDCRDHDPGVCRDVRHPAHHGEQPDSDARADGEGHRYTEVADDAVRAAGAVQSLSARHSRHQPSGSARDLAGTSWRSSLVALAIDAVLSKQYLDDEDQE